jgi:L-lysine 2,3-aminomutase
MQDTTIADWTLSLKNSITSLPELFQYLAIDTPPQHSNEGAADTFSMRVSREYANRIDASNPNDPLLLQILPQTQELSATPGYQHDPVGDNSANPVPGLLHKYHGRVLLIASGGCAIHCRYCFRRHFDYAGNLPGSHGWQGAMDYITHDSSIEEVILSGGDPLTLKDKALINLINKIEAIPHVMRLRIHSRLPIIIPARMTQTLLSALKQSRLQIILVIHCNHANEIDNAVTNTLKKCSTAGVTLFNQTVLLKGINDRSECLISLNKKLFNSGVIPYYLHILDKVVGAAHFYVNEPTAKNIMQQLRQQLPGYLVPTLVREDAGALHKTPLL